MRLNLTTGLAWLSLILLLRVPLYAQEQFKKAPVPNDDALASALKLVKEVYGDEYAKAKTPDQKKALAQKLLQKARESDKDPPAQFALLRLSRDVATQAADGLGAFRAIDQMDRVFNVDALEMKTDVLAAFTKKARAAEDHKSIVAQALPLLHEAVAKDDFALATRLGELALPAAQSANDPPLLRHVQIQVKETEAAAKGYADVKTAMAILEKTATDPHANLVVGKYLCFVKGDWDKGIAMLALGEDETLKVLAANDLRGASSSADQMQMGDRWWDVAEREAGTARKQLRLRAHYWYRQVLPTLSGLLKDKVEKRLRMASITDKADANAEGHRPAATAPNRHANSQWSPILIVKTFGLAPKDWRIGVDSVVGRVGDIDKHGVFWSKAEYRTNGFHYGFKMKAVWYQDISVQIDGAEYSYGRGWWKNAGTQVIAGARKIRYRSGPKVDDPNAWAALSISLKNDHLEMYYNERLEFSTDIPKSGNGSHSCRLGFSSHNAVVALKDFQFKQDAE